MGGEAPTDAFHAVDPSRQRTFAGPFLRYHDLVPGAGPPCWLGSLLFLTRHGHGEAADSSSSGDAPGASGSGSSPASAQPAPPGLLVEDPSAVPAGPTAGGPPALLDTCLGWHFWRFELQFVLAPHQRPITYTVQWNPSGTGGGGSSSSGGGSGGSAPPATRYQFWLPAVGQSFHCAYYSCNGFSTCIPPNALERQDPLYLWRDLLQVHASFPMHTLIGGGDQLYNDGVWKAPALRAWTALDSRTDKLVAPWTDSMQEQATDFYLHNYVTVFMQDSVLQAFATIPGVMQWDDHDIWDGYGSYPDAMQDCPVFQGLFAVAKRFYLLFQQHTTHERNLEKWELFGVGEYHFLKPLGPEVALLGIDMRTKRRKGTILPQASCDLLNSAVLALPGSVRHLIVMSGVPLVFPKLPLVEEVLETVACLGTSSRLIRNMARNTGLMDPYVGAQPEILDDLVDGWAATIHTEERLAFIHLLQSFSERQGLRVTLLSGDAHVGGVGRLYSRKNHKDPSRDPLFIPQIISSAITNGPPPNPLIRMMHRFNYAKNVDERTREKMVRLFRGPLHPRFHKLLGQRNWCDISVQVPPFAPPMSPSDANYGALRFSLRCENARRRTGHAEEVYDIVVPRLYSDSPQNARDKAEAAAPAVPRAVAAAPAAPSAIVTTGAPAAACGTTAGRLSEVAAAPAVLAAQPSEKEDSCSGSAVLSKADGSAAGAAAVGRASTPQTPALAAPLLAAPKEPICDRLLGGGR